MKNCPGVAGCQMLFTQKVLVGMGVPCRMISEENEFCYFSIYILLSLRLSIDWIDSSRHIVLHNCARLDTSIRDGSQPH